MADHGRPNETTGFSVSTCWIVAVDKLQDNGESITDVFYFCKRCPLSKSSFRLSLSSLVFYPYNYGNTVCFTAFGNHVGMSSISLPPVILLNIKMIGDWEHIMIRFKNEVPQAIHLSAHADGHSFAWSTIEKQEERPVAYVASGSRELNSPNRNSSQLLTDVISFRCYVWPCWVSYSVCT